MEKSITLNAIFNVFNKALSVIFPVITIAYVSRVLGAAGIGVVASAQNLATYFTMFAALGIPSYGVKAISQSKIDKNECNKVFSELFLVNLFSTLVCFGVYFILLGLLKKTYTYTEISLIFSVLILMNMFNIEWVYQGFEEYKYIALRSLFVKIIALVLLFFLVRSERDILGYAVVLCIGTVGNNILNMIKVGKFVKFTFKGLNIKRHMVSIMTFFASVVAIEVYSLLDITMLTAMKSSECVGFYTNATKIVKMIANTITSFSAVLMPRLSYYFSVQNYDGIKEVSRKFLKVSLLISVPAFFGIIITSDYIVKLFFGDSFMPVSLTIRILSVLIISMPLTGGVFCQLLLTSGYEKKYFVCVLLGSIMNASCNYLLIPNLNQNGAALASIISELVVCLTMILFSRKIVRVQISFKDFICVVGPAVIMALIIQSLKIALVALQFNTIFSLVIIVVVAIIVYGVALVVLNNEEVISILHRKQTKRQCH